MFVSLAPGSWFRTFKITLASLTFVALCGSTVSALPIVPNDYFINAAPINLGALPTTLIVSLNDASIEPGEPQACTFSIQTVWYKLTPSIAAWFSVDTQGSTFYGGNVSVFRDSGSGIFGLNFVGCSAYNGSVTFSAQANTTYYLQGQAPCCGVNGTLHLNVARVPAPLPVALFYYYPSDPSAFDAVQFSDQSYDPGQLGIQSRTWHFDDGTTDTGCCPTHFFGTDGDHPVRLTVTTIDGRTDDTTQVVRVRTHDVAITQFKVPQSASSGQTRSLQVGIRNNRFPETVRVELSKSVPNGYYGGFQPIGYLDMFVPVRASNRTTDFNFSYTFTPGDAQIGKVTFKAVATILTGRDALSADNEAISFPVKVGGSGTAPPPPDSTGDSTVVLSSRPEKDVSAAAAPRLALLNVAPNPANAGVDLAIRLSLSTGSDAQLQVLDVTGRVMAKRELGSLGAGVHDTRVGWERRPAPGIYWVRLTQGGKSVSTRLGILQ